MKGQKALKFPYACIDTETTGLNHWPKGTDEIIEVTVKQFNDMHQIGEVLSTLCRPAKGCIDPDASRVNGITMSAVEGKPNYLSDGVRERVAEIIGPRTLVGHNIIKFDIPFLMIEPRDAIDTYELAKQWFKGRLTLKSLCKKMKLQWDDLQAHRAEYDVDKNIELFLAFKKMLNDNQTTLEFVMRDIEGVSGIVPDESDKMKVSTMVYSYSRLKLFHECRLRWYYTYLKPLGRVKKDYFTVGRTCHTIGEECGKWCHRQKWIISFVEYQRIKLGDKFDQSVARDMAQDLYDNKALVKEKTQFESFSKLYNDVVHVLQRNAVNLESDRMPPIEVFAEICAAAKAKESCIDPAQCKDVDIIMGKFYKNHDFTSLIGELSLFEKDLAIDKDGNPTKFFAKNAWLRGKVDIIDFYDNAIVDTDYKSSRVMMSEEEMARDMQTKIYIYLILKALSLEPAKNPELQAVIRRVNYLRFGKTVQHVIEGSEEIQKLLDEVEVWVKATISEIEKEVAKEKEAFAPERCDNCIDCDVAEAGRCPLFNNLADGIDDMGQLIVKDVESCKRAWKQLEKNTIENNRLRSECKNFVKMYDGPIVIDDKAYLGFYQKDEPKINLATLTKLLHEEHDIAMEAVLEYGSINKTNFEKLLKHLKLKIREEDYERFVSIGKKNDFTALTQKQREGDKYNNA